MSKKAQKLEAVLAERKSQHGDFKDHAKISQELKRIVQSGVSYNQLNDIQKEGLEMVLHKIARIVSGDPNYIDAWRDMSGYSTLVMNNMLKTPGCTDSNVQKIVIK